MFKIESQKFNPSEIVQDGNKFIIGNGYMGYRGTLDEFTKDQLVAINLPGIYDTQPGKWCDSVNAPNPLYTFVEAQGEKLTVLESKIISHVHELNMEIATFGRQSVFKTDKGNITIASKRFVSSNNYHLIGQEFSVKSSYDTNVVIYTGIDADIWDINGPHLENETYNCTNGVLIYSANTIENKTPLRVYEKIENVFDFEIFLEGKKFLRKIKVALKAEEEYRFKKLCYLTYENELVNFDLKYDIAKKLHEETFKKQFDLANILLEGDDLAQLGISYSIYHLLIIAPKHSSSASIPARGISGQVYKGAIFWDTEMFMLPFFLLTDPIVARTLIKYRIDTLQGAKNKAKELGYDGAYYAWESISGGYDACTLFNVTDPITNRPIRTYFKDKQIHISADIVYGLCRYLDYTNDYSILIDGGIEVLIEVAKFYYSYLYYQPSLDRYVVCDVTGPDEYHERVNNNAYTNQMVLFGFKMCLKYLDYLKNNYLLQYKKLNTEKLEHDFKNVVEKLYIPNINEDKVIEQFDGYFQLEDISLSDLKSRILHPNEYLGGASGIATNTKIIKQADVITMLVMFKELYDNEIIRANFDYYLPRTEHGSSLSASMYALAACYIDLPNEAYLYFIESALIDYYGKGKQYAGKIYIGGTHPAASGGAYLTAVYGFANLKIIDNELQCDPKLPDNIKSMKFKTIYQGYLYHFDISGKKVTVFKEKIK